eukprot:1137483-Pelagomonas_calceolata.AAC.1
MLRATAQVASTLQTFCGASARGALLWGYAAGSVGESGALDQSSPPSCPWTFQLHIFKTTI